MTQHKDQTRLRHMLAHAQEAVEMARMRSRQDLDTDRQLNLSLVRLTAPDYPHLFPFYIQWVLLDLVSL